jgi:hypothetical protein
MIMKKLLFAAFMAFGASALMAQHTYTGSIVSRVGPKLVLKLDSVTALPTVGKDSVDISKDISGTDNPFGINITSGWVGIGKLIYVGKSGTNYQFRIAKETTSVVVNGVKKEQFVTGKKVKIQWGEADGKK